MSHYKMQKSLFAFWKMAKNGFTYPTKMGIFKKEINSLCPGNGGCPGRPNPPGLGGACNPPGGPLNIVGGGPPEDIGGCCIPIGGALLEDIGI